jgi:hypothetical protein
MRMLRMILMAVCALAAGVASADIIVLANGQRLEGSVVSKKDGRVTFRTTSGITTTVDADRVLAVEERPTLRDVYRRMAAKVEPDDAEGHYALALWCRDRGLRDAATAELVETLHADPDHAAARKDLGYVKTADGWISREDAMRAKGMVQIDGRWLDKEKAEKLEQKAENRRILSAINAVVYKIHTGSRRTAQEHEQKLAGFGNAKFAWKMLRLLDDRDPQVRRAACASLAKMKHRESVPRLAGVAVVDSSDTVRAAALAAAKSLGRELAAEAFYLIITKVKLRPIHSVADQKVAKIAYARIAAALGEVGDVRSVPFLIQILYPSIEIESAGLRRQPLGPTIVTGTVGPGVAEVVQGTTAIGTIGARPFPREPSKYFYNAAAERVLKKLTGQNRGVLPRDWAAWWQKHGAERIRKFEAARRAEAGGAEKLLEGVERGEP